MPDGLYQFAFKMDDPTFAQVPRAAASKPTRKRVPGRTEQYVEESDSEASWKDAARPPEAGTRKVYT